MDIGDMVVRAYAFRKFIPGVIIDEVVKSYDAEGSLPAGEEHNFIVAWSDGTQSSELYEELDHLSEALEYQINGVELYRYVDSQDFDD